MAELSAFVVAKGLQAEALEMSRGCLQRIAGQVAGNERSGKTELWKSVINTSRVNPLRPEAMLFSGWDLYAHR